MWLLLSPAFAQSVDPFEEEDESELFRFEEQLVTVASRYAQTVRKAPSIVAVITADQIRERGYRTVSDALRELPGIYIWKSTEGRDLAAIRGVVSADNNKLLVLVDGMPWYDGVYTHGFIDDYLPISNIRQIEVIKGPGSAIYGTNAFSGVINVVTFSASELEGGRARWMVGTTGRSDVTATAGGRSRIGLVTTDASVYARVFSQSGTALELTPESEIDAPNTDPRKAANVGVKLAAAGVELQLHHVDYSHVYLINSRQDPFDALAKTLDTFDLQYHNTFGELRYRYNPRQGSLELSPYVWYQRHDNPASYFFGGDISLTPATGTGTTGTGTTGTGTTGTGTTGTTEPPLQATQSFITVDAEKVTERVGYGFDAQLRPALDHVVVAGVGLESVRVLRFFDQAFPTDGDPFVLNSFAIFDDCGQVAGLYTNNRACVPPRLRNLFGYAQYTWTAAPFLELTAGGRFDKRLPSNKGEQADDGAFQAAISPRLGVLVVPSDRVTAKLLYGRAFRAPNVREILVTAEIDPETEEYAFSTGNLNLVPETIHTVEGELVAGLSDKTELRADGSWSLLVNEIDKIVPPRLHCNLPGDLTVLGGELGVRTEAGPLAVQGDYALTLASYGPEDKLDQGICKIAWDSPFSNRDQYEFPPHMLKGSLRLALTDTVSTTLFGEAYAARNRRQWSPDARQPDGEPFALLHLAARAASLGPGERFEIGFTARNLLGTAWDTGIYRDDANDRDLPTAFTGEGRRLLVSLEGKL
jgi:outer membrane receptor protein involved in Fe transport